MTSGYIRRIAATRLIALIHSELLQLDQYDVTRFDLDHANEAVAHVAAPVQEDVLKPRARA
jgi:alcohol dehydrogenase